MEENKTTAETAPLVEIEAPKQDSSKKSLKAGIWEFVRFAVVVIAVVVGIRIFVAQPFVVAGTSMIPTFQNSNYLIVDEISYDFNNPSRGDVIVFHPPIDPSTYYIKRVIGIPGDTNTIKDSVVTITNAEHPNGEVLTEPYITPDAPGDNFSVTVPAGEYFTMGDNRPASFDSRRWGLLPRKNITGRVLFRLFPFNEINLFPGKVTIN